MKKLKLILLTIAIIAIMAFMLTSCNFTLDLNSDSMTGSIKSSNGDLDGQNNKGGSKSDDVEKETDTEEQEGSEGEEVDPEEPENAEIEESEYQEADIIKVYKDNIYYLNRKGLKIVHIDKGNMEMNNRLDIANKNGSDVLVYKNNLILLLNVLVPNSEVYHIRCEISIYDITNLNRDGFDFPLIKKIVLEGLLRSARIYNGDLYVVCTDRIRIAEFNYSVDGVGHNFEDINRTYFNSQVTEEQQQSINYATINTVLKLDILDLNAMQVNAYYGTLKEFCLFPQRSYLIFSSGPRDTIAQINTETLAHVQLLKLKNGFTIYDRGAISDDGQYFMVVSGNETIGAKLTIYNAVYLTRVISEISNIFPGERVTNVSFTQDYCYIVTALFKKIIIDPVVKINIMDKTKPVIEDYLKIDGFSQVFSPIPNTELAFSLANNLILSLYNIANDEVLLVDTIDLKTHMTYCLASVDPRYVTLDLKNHTIFLFGYQFNEDCIDTNIVGIKYSESSLSYYTVTTVFSDKISLKVDINFLTPKELLAKELFDFIVYDETSNDDRADLFWLMISFSNDIIYEGKLDITDNSDIHMLISPFAVFYMVYFNLYNSRCIIVDNYLYYVSIDEIVSFNLALGLEYVDILEFDKNTVDIYDLGKDPMTTFIDCSFLMLFFSAEGFYIGNIER